MIRTDLIAPVSELLERQAKRFPDKIAYSDAKRAISYADLETETRNLATQLLAKGLGESGAVALWIPNGVDWVVACFAIVRAGGLCVPISYDSTKTEVAYRLEDAACDFVITKPEQVAALDAIAENGPNPAHRIIAGGDAAAPAMSFTDLVASPADGVTLVTDDIDRVSYLVYTSGTTGRAKGVKLTTRSMLWVTASCWAPISGLCEDDRVLSPLPLFHSYALNLSVLSILAVGASEHIMEKFSTAGAIEHLSKGEFTFMPGVPTMFHYLLLAAKEQGSKPFNGVRCCVSAGAIMPGSLNNDFESYFGVQLLDGYGITETSTMVTMNWPGKYRVPGSCGLPLPGLAVRIIDPVSGKDVEFGGEGELICRGPNLMQGYHNKPEETASALRDGWYHTGDLARSDKSGFLTITGRLKELIIRGGQNIAPAEIEETILLLDEVRDCAIVGVSHETLGEVPAAFIVAADCDIDPDRIRAFCRERLSGYKVPEHIHIVEEIPRTGSGKIMRFKLRDLVE
ncbi:MAG: AMP-binding protein [Rhodobiaceae bacterium]|nr:AMP-binding protein [Rhodobiaceae bacterium]